MKLAERIFHRTDFRLTSPYGMRVHTITGVKQFHYGVDYGTKLENWGQYALEEGTVLSCGVDTAPSANKALFVWVSYPRLNLKLLHYHLNSVNVHKGQKVDENTLLGFTGKTGNSTAIHLHLGAKHISDNAYFDPETFNYIPLKKDTEESPIGKKAKIEGLKYSNGKVIPSWVKQKLHYIGKISGDNYLLVGEVKNGQITNNGIYSWINKKDIVIV